MLFLPPTLPVTLRLAESEKPSGTGGESVGVKRRNHGIKQVSCCFSYLLN